MTIHATARQAQDAAARARHGFPANPARHLVGRLGYGAAGADLLAHDPDAWLRDQFAKGFRLRGYQGIEGLASAFPCLPLNAQQTRAWLKEVMGGEMSMDATVQLEYATLLLQACSPAQVYEAVVDVMSNHLNVANGQLPTWCARITYDRDVIRAHAFGRFDDMLVASAADAAMLIFLSGDRSFAGAINENYGRELLELHTVGRAAGYTQAEVVSSAKLMTGRTVDYSKTMFNYAWKRHHVGPVRVLGFQSANSVARGSMPVSDAYLRYLAHHPCTASNLARKFCVRFVSDQPSTALVNAVAKAYLDASTSIPAMVQTIIRSQEFWSSAGAKFRRPAENVIATVRATGARPVRGQLRRAGARLSAATVRAGQQVLAYVPPDGYPDTADVYETAGVLTATWQFQFDLARGALAGAWTTPNATSYATITHRSTIGEVLRSMHRTLTGVAPTTSQVEALAGYLGEPSSRRYTGSALPSALPAVVALILHGPAHAFR